MTLRAAAMRLRAVASATTTWFCRATRTTDSMSIARAPIVTEPTGRARLTRFSYADGLT